MSENTICFCIYWFKVKVKGQGEKHDKQSRLEENLKVIKAKNQGNEQEKRRKDN